MSRWQCTDARLTCKCVWCAYHVLKHHVGVLEGKVTAERNLVCAHRHRPIEAQRTMISRRAGPNESVRVGLTDQDIVGRVVGRTLPRQLHKLLGPVGWHGPKRGVVLGRGSVGATGSPPARSPSTHRAKALASVYGDGGSTMSGGGPSPRGKSCVTPCSQSNPVAGHTDQLGGLR